MKRRDLVLAVIGLCGDRPEFGRTSLQKVTYWAGSLLGLKLDHDAYFYGPFSPSVEHDVEGLVFSGLVEEKSRTLGINRAGWPVAKYEYKITDLGKGRLLEVKGAYPNEYATLQGFVSQLVDAAGGLHQQILAPATKVMFIKAREKRNLTLDEISRIGSNLGWKLSEDQVSQVQRVIDSLGSQSTLQ